MRNKFLGTGGTGYHPLRKIAVCLSGIALWGTIVIVEIIRLWGLFAHP